MPKLSPICIVTAPLLAPPAAQYLLALLWVSILCLFSPHLRAAEGIELSADSFTLATPSRPATTLLDAHFTLSQGNLGGALGICKPEPMFGVTPLVLKAHGLTGQFLEALATWKEVSTLLTDPQCERINAFFTRPKGASSQFNHHLCSPVVPVARHVDGRYEVVPTRVLTRKAGDIPWQHGQEHGPISPRQFIRPGETLLLENPEAAQPLQFIIHVLPAFNPQSKAATAAAGIGAVENVLLQPAGAQAIRADGPTSARIEGNTLVLTASNSGDRAQREIEQLPSWNLAVDMTQQRGLGLWVTGDNSGALVLVELGRRDYVLPIDFNGRRYIEIPNGEVSWASSAWGWRKETKSTDYSKVRCVRIGFGELPPQAKATVKIEQLTALGEIPVALQNPAYGTGFSVYVLRLAGRISEDDPRIRRAVTWLRTHQRASGYWYTRSPRNSDELSTYVGTAYAILALKACGGIT
ncbi:MAG: hypothetical protein IMZ44_00730 [Planctomycetes bacterium]|nr:hypothetical protein [Planctomycetota bacterium]